MTEEQFEKLDEDQRWAQVRSKADQVWRKCEENLHYLRTFAELGLISLGVPEIQQSVRAAINLVCGEILIRQHEREEMEGQNAKT